MDVESALVVNGVLCKKKKRRINYGKFNGKCQNAIFFERRDLRGPFYRKSIVLKHRITPF